MAGQAKLRQYSRKEFLKQHPVCCYCGDPADTTDHCPPRSFFVRRQWPETFEFPACHSCNGEGRLDEQIVGILKRLSIASDQDFYRDQETEKLLRGLANNQPEILDEWNQISTAGLKRYYRETFGEAGDALRHQGMTANNVGQRSQAAVSRFMVKLSKALYYKHTEALFDGQLYIMRINAFSEAFKGGKFDSLLSHAPNIELPSRGKEILANQFIYRYAADRELGAIHAIIQFSEQMLFQIIGVCEPLATELSMTDTPSLLAAKIHAPLKNRERNDRSKQAAL